jgi:general secretion pathway protein H
MELLAVIVIVGVLVGGVALTMVDRGAEQLDRESRRFVALLQTARDEAVLQARSRAVGLWLHGYQFYVRSLEDVEAPGAADDEEEDEEEEQDAAAAARWVPVSDDRTFRPRDLGERIRLDLYLEGIRSGLEANPPETPQVYLLSSGEVTPFELVLSDPEGRERVLEVDPLGRLLPPEDERD